MTDNATLKVLFLDFDANVELAALIAKEMGDEVQGLHLKSDELTAQKLETVAPDCLIFALFGPTRDAGQMVGLLEALAYKGAMMVLASSVAQPDHLEAELRALGPGRRLTLVMFAPSQPE